MARDLQAEWTPPACPDQALAHHQEAVKLAAEGRLPGAKLLIEKVVELRPGNASAQLNLAMVCHQLDDLPKAIEAYESSLRLVPNSLPAWTNLASAYAAVGMIEAALAAARKALHLDRYSPLTHRALANVLKLKGDLPASMEVQRQAQAIEEDPVLAKIRASTAARTDGRLADAWQLAQEALSMAPEHPEVHCHLGELYLDLNQIEQAIVSHYKATELAPDRAQYWTKLGHGFMYLNLLAEAKAAYKGALACDPNDSEARYNSAWAHLLSGEYAEGWPGFVERWNSMGPRYAQFPVWQGEPLGGRTILLYAEQGFGDTIHFSRYVTLVAEQGGRVILECAPHLKRLLQTLPGVDEVIGFGEPVPRFELQASLFSLPIIFRTALPEVPNTVPYLRVPSDVAIQIPPIPGARLKVGLVWSSSSMRFWRQDRSIPLQMLQPVWSIPEVAFYSLQVGSQASQLQNIDHSGRIIDLGPQLGDFAATAAAIAQMDLMIVVDTSVAHLAGALGKPAWLLLIFAPDWRWMLERNDSVWYPALRLFRQNQRHSWENVVQEISAELLKIVERV
jgi:Flp pilus assembly protein TadD